jgi:prephenate dehydratase
VLEPADQVKQIDNADKASLIFSTDHSKGSLAKVLTKIADGDINLSKLQSMPIPGSDWKYAFHADLEFKTIDQFNKVVKNIEPLTEDLKVYGIYKNGR